MPVRSNEVSTNRPRPVCSRSCSAARIPATDVIAAKVSPRPCINGAGGWPWVVISWAMPVRPKNEARS
jgi:hypothetical protein